MKLIRNNRKLPILNYHLVRDDLPPGDLVISKGTFEQHMKSILQAGYVPIHVEQWIHHVQNGRDLPDHPVMISIDDGFQDCYDNAWPILRKLNIPFTVFLVTEKVGGVNEWDGLMPGELQLLNTDQVQQMFRAGVQFQVHSSRHPHLPNADDTQLQHEIHESMSQLQLMIGVKPACFAYPYGQYDARVRRVVVQAGYEAACTTWPGLNDAKTDLFQLKRIAVSGRDTVFDLRMKLRYGFGVLSYLNFRLAVGNILRRLRVLKKHEIEDS